jgi:hypothetical protein
MMMKQNNLDVIYRGAMQMHVKVHKQDNGQYLATTADEKLECMAGEEAEAVRGLKRKITEHFKTELDKCQNTW